MLLQVNAGYYNLLQVKQVTKSYYLTFYCGGSFEEYIVFSIYMLKPI